MIESIRDGGDTGATAIFEICEIRLHGLIGARDGDSGNSGDRHECERAKNTRGDCGGQELGHGLCDGHVNSLASCASFANPTFCSAGI